VGHERGHSRLGRAASGLTGGAGAGALAAWEKGLEIDPGNYILSTSIWAATRPDDFYPNINPEYRATYAEFMERAGINWREDRDILHSLWTSALYYEVPLID
jgi:hypothetical protein